MILVDGQRIEDVSEDLSKEIKKGLAEIRKETDEVCFQDPNTINKSRMRRLNDGRLENQKPVCIPLVDTATVPGYGYATLSIIKGTPIRKDGEYIIKQRRMWVKGSISYKPQDDPEMIYFLRNFSSKVKRGALVERNYTEEEKIEAQTLFGDSDVKYLIGTKYSPISKERTGSDELMRLLAASWNVSNADKLSYDKLKTELYNTVITSEKRKGETGRGIQEFLEDINSIESDKLKTIEFRANVRKALNKQIIIDEGSKNRYMMGGLELFRYPASRKAVKFEQLIKFLENNPNKYEDMELELYGEKTGGNMYYEIKMCNNMPKMKKYAKEVGLDPSTPYKKLKEHLLEYYKE